MRRCLDLAKLAEGHTGVNPLVGSVIVVEGNIVAEGYHKRMGGPHAEVEAFTAWGGSPLPSTATVYVNLEPCAHFGRTPPCADMLIARQVKHVIIGTLDPNPLTAGEGVRRMKAAGMKVECGMLEKESKELNHRFFVNQLRKRPYIILKWAETCDGFTAMSDNSPLAITGAEANILSHKWRTQVDAIAIGSGTMISDSPSLTARNWPGKSPRPVLFSNKSSRHADDWVLNKKPIILPGVHLEDELQGLLKNEGIGSLMVEGGTKVLSSFIAAGLYDEIRVYRSAVPSMSGYKAPCAPRSEGPPEYYSFGGDSLTISKFTNY